MIEPHNQNVGTPEELPPFLSFHPLPTRPQMPTPQQTRRRYFLHRKAKKFLNIDTRARAITVTEEQIKTFTRRQLNTFNELVKVYRYECNYAIQFELNEQPC